jgi:tetratricopeptide (TPR) repeat protein
MTFRHRFLFFIIMVFFITVTTLMTVSTGSARQNEVQLTKSGGVYEVPVVLNGVLAIRMILDSGASDVSLSPDIAMTLYKTNTIAESDWLPGAYYTFADGSSAKSFRFRMRSLMIGDVELTNVACSISNSIHAPMLLGQTALQKLGKYSIDTERMVLIFGESDATDHDTVKISKVHPDYKKYWADGSLQAWIREQPESTRKEMQRVYEKGNAKEVINLLTRFKKFLDSPEGLYLKASDQNISSTVAIDYLTKAINEKPDYAEAYESRATAYSFIGKHELALEDYNKSVNLKPTSKLFIKRAETYSNLGRYEKAVEDYTSVISLEPDNAYQHYRMRGETYIELGEHQRALDDFTRCFSLKPKTASVDYELYLARGRVYSKTEQYERAIEDYNKSINLEPSATAYRNRGIAYLNMGENHERGCSDVREACHMGLCKTLDELLKKKICPCEKEDWLKGRSICKM